MRTLVASLILAEICAFASTAGIKWLNAEYDFGTIREDAGLAQGKLVFVNIGDKPSIINSVRTSCGCTSARWPEGEIMPGDTAVIRFAYNPEGRPGRFEKTIRVTTGEDNVVDILKIRGNVIGDSATISKLYPYGTGPLRVSANDIQLGSVDYGTPRNQFVYAFNSSLSPVVLRWGKLPSSITTGLSSDTVKAGETASIGIYYDSRQESEMGPHLYNIELNVVTPQMTYLIPFRVNVNVIPVVKVSAKQVSTAGRITFDKNIAYIGELKPGKSAKFKFKVKNEGKECLDISRVYSQSSDIRLKKYPLKIMPGASSDIEGVFMSDKDMPPGAFSHKIIIMSNDPVHPVENVRVSGIILDSKK